MKSENKKYESTYNKIQEELRKFSEEITKLEIELKNKTSILNIMLEK